MPILQSLRRVLDRRSPSSVTLKVPAGARVFLGAPAQPMEEALVGSITKAVALSPDILEAHLPQCFVPQAMKNAAQVLVLVVAASCRVEPIVAAVGDRLSGLLP